MILSLPFWEFVGISAGIYAIFALGLQLQFGHAGLMNFGHVAFMAIGSYTMALLIYHLAFSMWLAAIIAIAVAMVVGALLAFPTVRVRADYLAITTIAFGEIIRILILNQVSITRGPRGLFGFTSDFTNFVNLVEDATASVGIRLGRDRVLLVMVWLVVALILLVLRRLVRSPWGRVLRAIREDEDAARALGKNVFVYKLQVMAIGSALAAVAGIFLSFQLLFLSPDSFEPVSTFFAWVIVLLGGAGQNIGVPVGALVFAVIFAGTRFAAFWPFSLLSASDLASVRMIVIGCLLIALMAFRPQGIFGKREELLLDR